jgi:hypothetical protein
MLLLLLHKHLQPTLQFLPPLLHCWLLQAQTQTGLLLPKLKLRKPPPLPLLLQAAAAQAASDLDVASKVTVVGVVNGGRTICAAATTCTKAEILALNLKAAQTAVAAVNASNYAIYLTTVLRDQVLVANPTASVSAANSLLTTAQTAAAAAQTAANTTIANYQATATAFGTTGTTITASTGTTGTTGTVGVTGTTGTTGTN